jgi:hypothetical protein
MKNSTPLITGVSQREVDFVIPLLGIDLSLGIDPFLLYKSRDKTFSELHDKIIKHFNSGIEAIRENDLEKAIRIFNFPEAEEIGFGYTVSSRGRGGSGLGDVTTSLLIETLRASPELLNRGVKHIEEMQLFSVGIGRDRISDITANIIKEYLITYTQNQCKLWNIPLATGVPVNNILDLSSFEWYDDYVDLPVSTSDNKPIIFVPRRMVRTLPWINYDEFSRLDLSAFLASKKSKNSPVKKTKIPKEEAVVITKSNIELLEKYILRKEQSAVDAQPTSSYIDLTNDCSESEKLKSQLLAIKNGTAEASHYQRTILEIMNFLFNPELIDGQLEVRTIDETERRDIIFTNDSDNSFWTYLRLEHSNFLLMIETKNTENVDMNHVNQTNTYIGDRLGRLAIIASRNKPSENVIKKTYSVYNDSHPKKVILILTDEDFYVMLDMKCKRNEPMRHIQKLYRSFRQTVQ